MISELKETLESFKNSLELRLQKIENLVTNCTMSSVQQEEIIHESVNRALRVNNIIMHNVPEDESKQDVDVVNDILESVDPAAVASPEDVCRMGPKHPGRLRLLKIRFKNPETAKVVLRKRHVLRKGPFNNIIIHEDRTRAQVNYYKGLQSELKARQHEGQSDLAIKYVNGIPKIVGRNSPTNTSDLN